MTNLHFPKDFLWGAATSAYQIEGAAHEDGRGPSIWDEFCKQPGAIADGTNADVACDHYHRYEEDLDLLAGLGAGAYRFSVSWPRVIPDGTGAINAAGLDFYDRLVDACLARGLEPWLTLYHWDLPQALERDLGGWRNRETANAFANYAEVMVRRLGDRVKSWCTFNELPCIADYGYRDGFMAPGAKESERGVRQVIHNLLVAHGLAVQKIRSASPNSYSYLIPSPTNRPVAPTVKIGLVHNPYLPEPFTSSPDDIAAARGEFHRRNAWMLDPIFHGYYPEAETQSLGPDAPVIQPGDMELIHQPLDWFGLNIYNCQQVIRAGSPPLAYEPDYPRTAMDWPITPDALYWASRFTAEVFSPPEIFITENGCAVHADPAPDGSIHDLARVAYLHHHLAGLSRAIAEGQPVKGWFAWSLLDNFEWHHGFTKRFGLVHVDYATQRRTPKLSAAWLGECIQSNQMG